MAEAVGRVAVLGTRVRVQGFALAGALVESSDDDTSTRAAWRALPADVSVVVLTPEAAAALGDLLPDAHRLTVVMP